MAIQSSVMPLFDDAIIRPAEVGEENIVLDLLAEAAAWLRGRGIAQWPHRFPVASVQRQTDAGEALLVCVASRPTATVAVAESDVELWGADTEPAYYLSRLAVARSASGTGLGYRIIDWVEARAAARSWRYVRLATASTNPALRRYYEHAGFRHVSDPPDARWPTSLYQRAVR
jgi:GNAT superfamily N-acetyltransferase